MNDYIEKLVASSLAISASGALRRAESASEAEEIIQDARTVLAAFLTDETAALLEAALTSPRPLAAVRLVVSAEVWDLLVSESLAIMEYPEAALSEPERRFLDYLVEASLS